MTQREREGMPRKIEVPIKDKILVTRDEAAALMSVSPGTINKLITLKVITPTWSGRNVLIAQNDLIKACDILRGRRIDLENIELVDVAI